jgi:hypothetical protein
MKTNWKTILASAAKAFRLATFVFGGYGEDKWRPAGRYTRPDYRHVRPVMRKGADRTIG